MNPKTTELLSRVIGAAERTLGKLGDGAEHHRVSGDPRRREELDRLADEVLVARDWPTDRPPRLINDWTTMLMSMLRGAEREGPHGRDVLRYVAIGKKILPWVKVDLGRALEQRPATTENAR